MKRLHIIISSIFVLFTMSINAQINRTLETKVADILMQLPTDDLNYSNKISSEIISLGEVGILKFCEKLKPLGTGDDTQVRFAINSLATYQGSLNNPIKENIVEKSLVKAIESSKDVEVKAFLIRRLALCGSDFSATFLSKNLKDDNPLFKPSLATMSSIGSEKSLSFVLESLDKVNQKNKIEIVSVLSSHRYKPATKQLEKLYKTEPEFFKTWYLMALAEIANKKSNRIIKSAVKKSNYKLDESKSIIAYIRYGNRLSEENKKLSTKIAKDILKHCKEDTELDLRLAALRILYSDANYSLDILIKESTKDDEQYQKEVFKIASNSLSDKNISIWIDEYQRANDYYKTHIVRLLGSIKDNTINDKCIIPAINSSNSTLKVEGIKAIAYQEKSNSILVLLDLLKSTESENELHAINGSLLRVCSVEDADLLIKDINNYNYKSKIVIVNILGDRNATSKLNDILALRGEATQVDDAIFKALPKISTNKNLAILLDLLNNEQNQGYIINIREAIIVALKEHSTEDVELLIETAKSNRIKYLPILPIISNKAGFEVVVESLSSNNKTEKALAIKALSEWQNEDAIPYLFSIAEKSNKEDRTQNISNYLSSIVKSNYQDNVKINNIEKIKNSCTNDKQKELLIESAGNVKSLSSLIFISQYLKSKSLKSKAANTIVKIVLPTPSKNDGLGGDEVKTILSKSINHLSGPDSQYIKIDATEYLEKMQTTSVDENFLTKEEISEGYTLLFNGRDLDSFVGNKRDYIANNYELQVRPAKGGHGNLYTKDEYSNFIFRFEFKLTPGANNGLGIHAPLEGNAAYLGKELQILDNTAAIYANLREYQYHGSVYGVIPAKRGFLNKVGEWNIEEVMVKGNYIRITLNGHIIVEGDMKEASKNGTIDHLDHPGLNRSKGHIGFLGHGSELEFRKIRVKELD